MKLFFLGTGAADGIPALFCDCDYCSAARQQGGKDRRFRSGVLIDDTIRIDFPPEALAQAHAYPHLPLHNISHLLFTHTHDDHFAVRELQYLSPTFAPHRKAPLYVVGTDYLLGRLKKTMGKFFEPAPLSPCAVAPFESYTMAHLTVTPIVAHHKEDEICLNYLLTETATGKTLLYASDTGWYTPPTWEFLEGRRLDAVVIECGLGGTPEGYAGHLSLNGCVAVKTKLVAAGGLSADAPFYLTHISHRGIYLHEELARHAAVHGISVAHDGLEIAI